MPLFEEKPRFKGCPPICIAANLPAFESVKALRDWSQQNSPRVSLDRIEKCSSCGQFHCFEQSGPDPAGESSGTGRSKK